LSENIIVAIDGPAGAGKSTIAKRVAARRDCLYLDTGAMYRAVALASQRQGVPLSDRSALARLASQVELPLSRDILDHIRTPEMSEAASVVSAISEVRVELVRLQQAYGAHASVVMEGRDIGSVVFPNATLKVFLDADARVRAQRRVDELRAKGAEADFEATLQAIQQRDHRDSTRPDSPLTLAPGAVRVDTTGLDIDQVEDKILALLDERIPAKQERPR
jgi:CMP/dCMP kinase